MLLNGSKEETMREALRTVARVASLALIGMLAVGAVDGAHGAKGGNGATDPIWVSPLGFLAEDAQTTIAQLPTNPRAIQVTATTTGDHAIQLGLTLAGGAPIGVGSVKPVQVTQVEICYEVVQGVVTGTEIDSGSLQVMTTPNASSAQELTSAAFPLASASPACTVVPLSAPVTVAGAQTLELILHFSDAGAKILLGAIRIDVQTLSH
jgi:hypothetical protein